MRKSKADSPPGYDLPEGYDIWYKDIPIECFSTNRPAAYAARCDYFGEEFAKLNSRKRAHFMLRQFTARRQGKFKAPKIENRYLKYLLDKPDKDDDDHAKIRALRKFRFGADETKNQFYKLISNGYLLFADESKWTHMEGGTNAGKTTMGLMYIINDCRKYFHPDPWGIGSRSNPHLKKAAMADFKKIMVSQNDWDARRFNKNDQTYTFKNGSQVIFVSLDDGDKFAGPRWRGFFFNELNRGISLLAVRHIVGRTEQKIISDNNPTGPYFFHSVLYPDTRLDISYLRELNYLGNETLTAAQDAAMDIWRGDEYNEEVYIWGRPGDLDDVIFGNIRVLEPTFDDPAEFKGRRNKPKDAVLIGYGLDVGGAGSDRSAMALVSIWESSQGYIVQEEVYSYSMDSTEIAAWLAKRHGNKPVVVDSQNKDTIKILRDAGIDVRPATKGHGSVNEGIAKLRKMKIFFTYESSNLIEEKDHYVWKRDNDDKTLDKVDPKCRDDGMDAMRYGFQLLDEAKAPTIKRRNEVYDYMKKRFNRV